LSKIGNMHGNGVSKLAYSGVLD